MADRGLQKTIHVACRELGLAAEDRQALQARVTGKESMRDMDGRELKLVVRELERMGFRKTTAGKRPKAKRADVRFCHVMWRLLHEAGAVERGGAVGLNAFIRARFGTAWGHVPIDIDAMQEHAEIDAVVQALKAMCARAGVDLSR